MFLLNAQRISIENQGEEKSLWPLLANRDARVRYGAAIILSKSSAQPVRIAAELFQAFDPAELRQKGFELCESLKRCSDAEYAEVAIAAAFGLLGSRFDSVVEV